MSASTGAERGILHFPSFQVASRKQHNRRRMGSSESDAAEDFGHMGSNAEGLQSKSKRKPAQGSESPMLQGFE